MGKMSRLFVDHVFVSSVFVASVFFVYGLVCFMCCACCVFCCSCCVNVFKHVLICLFLFAVFMFCV